MKYFLIAIAALFLWPSHAQAQNYSLPNNNAGCPSNCRQITWQDGSDIWNGGVLPSYTGVSCAGVVFDGATDQTTRIQNCINALSSNQATLLPTTGQTTSTCIFINGTLRLSNQKVLRGGGAKNTAICLGTNGQLTTQNFSHSANLNPATSFNVIPSTFTLSGTPTKGDTTVTCATGCASVSVGTWIKIFGNDNPALILSLGGDCDYCGDDTGAYLLQDFHQVTGIAGSVFTLDSALKYTPYLTAVTLSDPSGTEPAGAKFNIITFPTQKAGYENFHLIATGDVGGNPMIDIQGCLFCWVKGVESQYSGSNSNGAHIRLQYSYGNEIRDNYLHEQRSGASGAGYGIWQEWTNNNHKIENNIVRHSRHGIIWEGGGGGDAVLYNYVDDNYTDDMTYLGSARSNHGAHPYMNLWEGNIISHLAEDDLHGSSSHLVFFRNNFWGDETNDSAAGCSSFTSGNSAEATPGAQAGNYPICTVVPNFTTNLSGGPGGAILGFAAIDIFDMNNYMSFVANILGRTGMHANWAAATLRADSGSCCIGTAAAPYVYAISTAATGSTPNPNTTVLLHHNYDFKTNGFAYNDGGSNFSFAASWYYASKPAFIGSRPWPLIGPDVVSGNLSGTAGLVNTNPAYDCYWTGSTALHLNNAFDPSACYTSAGTPTVSLSPTSLAFGSIVQGFNSAKTVTLTNTGTGTLTLTSVALTTGTNFTITANTCGSVGAGSNCQVTITFSPLSLGALSDTLTFTSNAASSPDTVSITGTGVISTVPAVQMSYHIGGSTISTGKVIQ